MQKIVRTRAERLSVAEAKRLILDALPLEGGVNIFVHLHEDGSVDLDGPVQIERDPDVRRGAAFIDEDMPHLFGQLHIKPRLLYRPAITDFKLGSDPEQYTISHDEFVRLSEAYNVQVELNAQGALAESDDARTQPRPRHKSVTSKRDDDIIDWLHAHDINPMMMPAAPLGNKPWPLRNEIMKELRLTPVQAKESFARLRKAGRMSPATPQRPPRS